MSTTIQAQSSTRRAASRSPQASLTGWLIKHRRPAAQSLLILLVLIYLNFGLQATGVITAGDRAPESVPLLSPGLAALLPWLNLWLAGSLIVNGVEMVRESRPRLLSWLGLALLLPAIVSAFVLLFSGPMITINPAWSPGSGALSLSDAEIERGVAIVSAILLALLLASQLLKFSLLLERAVLDSRGRSGG